MDPEIGDPVVLEADDVLEAAVVDDFALVEEVLGLALVESAEVVEDLALVEEAWFPAAVVDPGLEVELEAVVGFPLFSDVVDADLEDVEPGFEDVEPGFEEVELAVVGLPLFSDVVDAGFPFAVED